MQTDNPIPSRLLNIDAHITSPVEPGETSQLF